MLTRNSFFCFLFIVCGFGMVDVTMSTSSNKVQVSQHFVRNALPPDTKCTEAGQYCVNRESSSSTCHVQEATESPLGSYLAGPFKSRIEGNKEMCKRYDPASDDPNKCGAVAPQGVCDSKKPAR